MWLSGAHAMRQSRLVSTSSIGAECAQTSTGAISTRVLRSVNTPTPALWPQGSSRPTRRRSARVEARREMGAASAGKLPSGGCPCMSATFMLCVMSTTNKVVPTRDGQGKPGRSSASEKASTARMGIHQRGGWRRVVFGVDDGRVPVISMHSARRPDHFGPGGFVLEQALLRLVVEVAARAAPVAHLQIGQHAQCKLEVVAGVPVVGL